MDPLQAAMLRTFNSLRGTLAHSCEAFEARLFMLYPDGRRVLARPMPQLFCEDHHVFSQHRPIGGDLEKLAAELTSLDGHRVLRQEMAPGFTGILLVINANWRLRGPIGADARHFMIGVAMTLDDRSLYIRHDLESGLNDVLSEDEEFAPEVAEQLRQLLWTIDDLHKIEPEPEAVSLVMVRVGQVAHDGLLPQWALAAQEAGIHIL